MDEEEKRFRADEKKAREKHLKAWEHAIAEKERTSRDASAQDSTRRGSLRSAVNGSR